MEFEAILGEISRKTGRLFGSPVKPENGLFVEKPKTGGLFGAPVKPENGLFVE
jgi:hypothetical protein